MSRDFDVILWGATGFTGAICAEVLMKEYGCDGSSLKWAIAGRSQSKLEALKKQLFSIEKKAADIPSLIADSNDLKSLKELAKRTKVVCTTVGPYNAYGKALLKACVEEGAHYCDLTGETNFIRYSIDSFHKKAEKNKLKIVHCCGYDSIPSDLGVHFLQEQSKKILGSTCEEVTFIAGESKGNFSGGTIASLLGVVEEATKDKEIRDIIMDPYALSPKGTKGPDKGDPIDIRYSQDMKSWTAPFLMGPINTRIVRRTNAILDHPYGKNFTYEERMAFGGGLGGWIAAEGVRAGIAGLLLFGAIPFTRGILEKTVLPAVGEGPSKTDQETGFFNISIYGRKKANKKEADIRVKVYGNRDPGYGATARMLTESAVALAMDKLPENYGVLTPASAFGLNTLPRLEKAGISFSAE
jgi:short subunit dehydrogenase-like uncharacterized protein